MDLKLYMKPARLLIEVAALFAALLVASWLAGQCREWRHPKPPAPIPSQFDPGQPGPGAQVDKPDSHGNVDIGLPDLTREQLEQIAGKYGLTLRPLAPKPTKPPTGPVATPEAPKPLEVPTERFPLLLAEETFLHDSTGVGLDVSAWLRGPGQRADLIGVWKEWQPPTPEVCGPGILSGFLGNEARWVKEIGAGYVYGGGKAGLGGWGSVAYRGPRTGHVTWGARGLAGGSVESGPVGFVGATASW